MSNIHQYPSFSSSLLEEIYRSFDDDFDSRSRCHSDRGYARRFKMPKTSNPNNLITQDVDDDVYSMSNYKHMIHQWMEKEKHKDKPNILLNSLPTGSNSSYSLHGNTQPSRKIPTLKPIRTGLNSPEFRRKTYPDQISAVARTKGGKKEGKKLQLQQRALKLYGDLKKVKQPISPGGKLATFLNSLFHTNNNNHGKKERTDDSIKVQSVSTPSTASSYSRSCLSKTPSSAGRFERRSVRFCPVTEVYDDGVCKMDALLTTLVGDEEFKVQIMEKNRCVEEVANESLNNNNNLGGFVFEDEEEVEEEDDESCCSSDLFELDNLLEIDMGERYRHELPVYETTHVSTNRAIADGFIL